MNNKLITLSKGSLVILCLGMFPSCDMFNKGKEDKQAPAAATQAASEKQATPVKKAAKKLAGTILASINGEPVLYESEFNKSIAQMLQSNPYFRGAQPESLPLSMKRKLFDELIKQKIIIANAQKTGINNNPEFVEAYEEMMQLVKDSLMVQFFEKGIYEGINVSDSETKDHYNKNKNQFVKVAGGVLVSGAKFKNEAAAQAFLSTASKDSQEFEDAAKEQTDAKFENFGRVSEQAAPNNRGFQMDMTPAPIKETALALKSLPKTEMVKVGKDFWVILASDKKDAEYFELAEIKDQIAGMLKNNKFKEAIDAEINTIKKNVTVDINEDYFKEEAPAAPKMKDKKDDVASAA